MAVDVALGVSERTPNQQSRDALFSRRHDRVRRRKHFPAGALDNDGRIAIARGIAPVWPDNGVHVRHVSGGVAVATAASRLALLTDREKNGRIAFRRISAQ